ncbi:MAG: hypothetical protein DRI57_27825 [Deltaproteobacteria bacterium]|nr:MAG: hypothetical protein DRI57_27825 [Deltaproteobacteria bacterium]
MTAYAEQKDIIVLVADRNMEFSAKGILNRHQSLDIRPVTYDIRVHPGHDPACLRQSHSFLQAFIKRYAYALVIFDREGCGKDKASRETLEEAVEKRLAENGWRDRSAAIVLNPELEIWIWSDSPHVSRILGWSRKSPGLRHWLTAEGFLKEGQTKPRRPKEAVENALEIVKKARSSSLYFQIAQKVSFNRCDDPAFLKLRTTLKKWFG